MSRQIRRVVLVHQEGQEALERTRELVQETAEALAMTIKQRPLASNEEHLPKGAMGTWGPHFGDFTTTKGNPVDIQMALSCVRAVCDQVELQLVDAE